MSVVFFILRRTRVRLKPETKTVETGALWTEEELPIETLFVTCFLYSKARAPKQKEKLGAGEIKNLLKMSYLTNAGMRHLWRT